jgi:transposase
MDHSDRGYRVHSTARSNARVEALNTKVRLITRRSFGFHSPEAAIALVMLACGPITLRLPHEQTHLHPHSG